MNRLRIEKQITPFTLQIENPFPADSEIARFVIDQDPVRLAVRFIECFARERRSVDFRKRRQICFRSRFGDQVEIAGQYGRSVENEIVKHADLDHPDAFRQVFLKRDRQRIPVDRRKIRIQHDFLLRRRRKEQRKDPRPEDRGQQRPENIPIPVFQNPLNHRRSPHMRR